LGLYRSVNGFDFSHQGLVHSQTARRIDE